MSPNGSDSEGSHQPDIKLKFHAGRFEEHIVNAIMLVQLVFGAMGVMMGGFILLAKDGFQFGFIAMAVVPFVIAYLLTYLYE